MNDGITSEGLQKARGYLLSAESEVLHGRNGRAETTAALVCVARMVGGQRAAEATEESPFDPGKTNGAGTAWLDQPVGFGGTAATNFGRRTWREMANGSSGGGREAILRWAVRSDNGHRNTTVQQRRRARTVLALAYGG